MSHPLHGFLCSHQQLLLFAFLLVDRRCLFEFLAFVVTKLGQVICSFVKQTFTFIIHDRIVRDLSSGFFQRLVSWLVENAWFWVGRSSSLADVLDFVVLTFDLIPQLVAGLWLLASFFESTELGLDDVNRLFGFGWLLELQRCELLRDLNLFIRDLYRTVNHINPCAFDAYALHRLVFSEGLLHERVCSFWAIYSLVRCALHIVLKLRGVLNFNHYFLGPLF